MDEPLVRWLVAGGIALVAFTVVVRIIQHRREAGRAARRAREVREQRGYLYMQQQEIERLAGRIIATSSTGQIPGFEIIRQIEAVFSDGQPSPIKAVETLKAVAAEKGANAIINLTSERVPSGKCAARGDAVIVEPSVRSSAAPRP